MSDALLKVKLLFVADELRDNPLFDTGVIVGYEPTITTKLDKQQREQVIAELCTKIKAMCGRRYDDNHDCISARIFTNAESVHVMFLYGRSCLSSTDEFEAFFQAANNIVRRARIATIRGATRC